MINGNSADNVLKENSTHCIERVCGIPVHCWPHEDLLAEMDRNIKGSRERLYICITNTESMYHAMRIPEHRAHIENARFSLCDGIGSVVGGRLQGKRILRFNGPDLMAKACKYGVEKGWRHFFCGGREGVALLLRDKLSKRFPGMITAGTFCPPFRVMTQRETADMVYQINNLKPDILWVGLGLLKQEAWIQKFKNKIDVPWFVGVGAAFDFHAGTVRRAPIWIRRIGFEWLYRLFLEPRMLKRNVWSFMFMFEAVFDGVSNLIERRNPLIRGPH